jgi:hypothetical protein
VLPATRFGQHHLYLGLSYSQPGADPQPLKVSTNQLAVPDVLFSEVAL